MLSVLANAPRILALFIVVFDESCDSEFFLGFYMFVFNDVHITKQLLLDVVGVQELAVLTQVQVLLQSVEVAEEALEREK